MSGRKWTRFTLVLMLLISMAANVGHTLLADSTIPTWLRMTGAVIWPLIVFLAIEVLVRNDWTRGFTHGAIRATILAPAIPAAITSYEHMHAVLLAMGERSFIAAIGPGAVDLLMIGCTLALLLTARKSVSIDEVLEKWVTEESAPVSPAPALRVETSPAAVESPAPAEHSPRISRTRAPWDVSRVAEMAIAGEPFSVAKETGIGQSTYANVSRVARLLREDPRRDLSAAGKLPSGEVVSAMRQKLVKA